MSDDLQALAERAVGLEVCPVDEAEFVRRLPNRPDWAWRISERLREYEEARRPLLSALEVAEARAMAAERERDEWKQRAEKAMAALRREKKGVKRGRCGRESGA